jgi:hypothetical protein
MSMLAEKQIVIPNIPQPMEMEKHFSRPIPNPLEPTIFHESWWLDIVTGGHYSVVEVSDNQKVVGRLPYFLRQRGGLKYSIMPPMTHFLGPAISPPEGTPATQFLRREKITVELIRKLPPASIYHYKCHRDITDTIAFQQEKFHTSVQFTYEILPALEETLWKNLRSEKRKKIRSAQKALVLADLQDPQEFWRFYDGNLKKKGSKNVCEQHICSRMIEGCLSRNRGRIHAAFDKNHRLVAAVFCIWDDTSSYYFMSSRAPEAHYGAISLLAWEAMKDATARGLIFDFDGLNNSNAVLFFTEFGGIISPRFIVTRQTLIGGLALGIKNRFRASRYFY